MEGTIRSQTERALARRSVQRSWETAEVIGRVIARLERAFTGKYTVQRLKFLGLLAAPSISLILLAIRRSPRQMWVQGWPTIVFVGLYDIALYRCVRIDGMAHLPSSGPVILAGNHINRTGLDAMLVGSKIFAERGRLPKFVTSANPTGRILRHFLRMMGKSDGVLLPIREGKTTEAMIQFLQNPGAFNREQPILGIFPAGKADRDFAKHMNGEWHTSAAVTAVETGAPIVPFFVEGLPYNWEPFDMLKAVARALYGKAFEFRIRFGPPIYTSGMGRDYKAIIEQVRQSVLRLSESVEESKDKDSSLLHGLESSVGAAGS